MYGASELALDHAGAWIQTGELDAAARILEEARALGAGGPRPAFLRGVVAQRSGRAADAEAAYREALAEDARHASAWNNLGAMPRSRRTSRRSACCARTRMRSSFSVTKPHW